MPCSLSAPSPLSLPHTPREALGSVGVRLVLGFGALVELGLEHEGCLAALAVDAVTVGAEQRTRVVEELALAVREQDRATLDRSLEEPLVGSDLTGRLDEEVHGQRDGDHEREHERPSE